MKKFLIELLLVMATGYALGLVLPWWAIVVAGAFSALLAGGRGMRDLFAGLLGGFLLWFLYSLFLWKSTDSNLPYRMADIFPGQLSPVMLTLITGLIGGLAAGFSCWTAGQLRILILGKKK